VNQVDVDVVGDVVVDLDGDLDDRRAWLRRRFFGPAVHAMRNRARTRGRRQRAGLHLHVAVAVNVHVADHDHVHARDHDVLAEL
jgi:hypothetical protein